MTACRSPPHAKRGTGFARRALPDALIRVLSRFTCAVASSSAGSSPWVSTRPASGAWRPPASQRPERVRPADLAQPTHLRRYGLSCHGEPVVEPELHVLWGGRPTSLKKRVGGPTSALRFREDDRARSVAVGGGILP